ncbi:GM24700 [Drosophila sechellia]|uniref:GM24700 n=1 Tax=Drosophila sechellia TaxID=7238 RepID=B4HF07_DROSE|nr:GM24700 [Drosophila sechellia]
MCVDCWRNYDYRHSAHVDRIPETFAETCPDFQDVHGTDKIDSLDFANRVLKQSGRDQM